MLFSPGSDLHYLFPQALLQHLRWNFFVYQGHDSTFFQDHVNVKHLNFELWSRIWVAPNYQQNQANDFATTSALIVEGALWRRFQEYNKRNSVRRGLAGCLIRLHGNMWLFRVKTWLQCQVHWMVLNTLVQKEWAILNNSQESDFVFYISLFKNKYLFFNWRIIALQNFVVFCQTSSWISHRCTYLL